MANDTHVQAVLDGNQAIKALQTKAIRSTGVGIILDLSGADLNGRDLTNRQLNGADLSGAFLEGADLSGSQLNWANFSQAKLKGANLQDAQLILVKFTGADLTDCVLDRSNLMGACLKANLTGASLRKSCLNRTLVTESIETANTGGGIVLSQALRFRSGVQFYPPFSMLKHLENQINQIKQGNFSFQSNRIKSIVWLFQAYRRELAEIVKRVTWSLVSRVGRLTLLTKASYITLALVPILAWLWPAVRALFNDYDSGIVASAKAAQMIASRLTDSGESIQTSSITIELPEQILELQQYIDSLTNKLSAKIIDAPNLPLSMVAGFFAALAVALGHLVLEMFGPELVKKAEKQTFVENQLKAWSDSSTKNDILIESFQFLRDTAEAKPDSYHPNLIRQFGRLIWVPERIDLDALPKAERQAVIVAAAATRRYELQDESGRFLALVSNALYALGLSLISFIVIRQIISILREGGLLQF